MVNGMLAHSDETDDSHASSHRIPAARSCRRRSRPAKQFGIDGTRFLRAVALGYDVGTRVTMTLGGAAFQMRRTTARTASPATLARRPRPAASRGLDAQQMRWMLDYAAQQASGIAAWQRDTEHIEKSFVFAGMPARNGVTAALLIQAGGTGVDDIFSGADNFFAGVRAEGRPDTPDREARRALRNHAHQHQEVDRRLADPGAARRDRESCARAPFDADQVQKVVVRVATERSAAS